MPSRYKRPMMSRARQRAQRRRQLLVLAAAAAALVVLIVAVALLTRGHGDDSTPVVARVPATEEPAVYDENGEAGYATTQRMSEATATPTPAPTPTPSPTPFTPTPTPDVNTGSKRALSRPTPTAEGFIPVFTKADTDENIIAITVDDCFQAENLKKIVDTAIANGGKLTIFPIGENAIKESQAQTLKYAWEQGFELENHTYSHSGLYNSTPERLAEQVYKQQMALSSILGVEYHCHFLRPKGGDARRDQRMQVYAQQIGYYGIAHWSCAGSTSTEKEIAKALKPGAIYLFHTTTTNDLDKLLNFMPYAVEKGYKLVTLNEMFGYPENETRPLNGEAKDYPVPALQPYSRVYDVYKPTRYSWGVYLLQEKLIELGYMKGEADGVYGHDCADCVKAYQKDHGLEPTGVTDVALQEQIFGVASGA